MKPTRRTVLALSALTLLAACKKEPKAQEPPAHNPIKAQIDMGKAGARSADSAIAASQARMDAQAAEAAAGPDSAAAAQ